MAYSNNSIDFNDTDNFHSHAHETKGDIWVSIASYPTCLSLTLTIEQANQVIDALSGAIGTYEDDLAEAKALAELDSQRDSIFEGAE